MQEQTFVGRERELAELWAHLEEALAWKGRACFVVGQAGSGKTALVRHFLHQALAAEPKLVVATGTCNAHTGVGDPYLPFREALAMLTDEGAAQRSGGSVSPENIHRLRAVLVRSGRCWWSAHNWEGPVPTTVVCPGASWPKRHA